jgi:hypothetical protein
VLAEGDTLHVVALAAGLLVLLGLLRLTRRARSRSERPIALTSQHRLHVVEVEGRRLLVGTGPGGPPRLIVELAVLPAWAHQEPRAWSAPDGR